MITLGQAIRNAEAVEREGARFYQMLAEKASDEQARAFFAQLARDEIAHAEDLERQGRELGPAFDQALADSCAKLVEQAPGWEHASSLTAEQAFSIALEAENYAALYYDTMADFASGATKEFLQKLAHMEASHAEVLRLRRAEFFK